MDVSKNRGTPKWMVYNGKPYEQMDDLGGNTPIFGSTPISHLGQLPIIPQPWGHFGEDSLTSKHQVTGDPTGCRYQQPHFQGAGAPGCMRSHSVPEAEHGRHFAPGKLSVGQRILSEGFLISPLKN